MKKKNQTMANNQKWTKKTSKSLKTKVRATQNPSNYKCDLWCSKRVCRSCFTFGSMRSIVCNIKKTVLLFFLIRTTFLNIHFIFYMYIFSLCVNTYNFLLYLTGTFVFFNTVTFTLYHCQMMTFLSTSSLQNNITLMSATSLEVMIPQVICKL